MNDRIDICRTPRADNSEATLVYLTNQATITPHGWLSRTEHARHPDRLVFDLDPSRLEQHCNESKSARPITCRLPAARFDYARRPMLW